MEASSATTGFFQELPLLRNQFHEDPSIQRVLKCRKPIPSPPPLPRDTPTNPYFRPTSSTVFILTLRSVFVPQQIFDKVAPEIEQLCNDALEPRVFDWVTDADKNQPSLSGSSKNAFGQPVSSKLVLSEGWRRLQDLGFEKG